MSSLMMLGDVILGRYEVVDILAQGGQAYVALGRDQQTGRKIVVKQLAIDPADPHFATELERFKREGNLRIPHPRVVNPSDFGQDESRWFIIFPYIEGSDIETLIQKSGGQVSPDQAVELTHQLLDTLAAVHANCTIHRDIKPANILTDPAHELYLIDFGICKITTQSTISRGCGLLGSIPWMPPEQVANAALVDHRADIYSTGAVMYYLLTGQVLFPGTSDPGQFAYRICNELPPPPSTLNANVPSHLDKVCLTALAKRPEDRFQTAHEFDLALTQQHGLNPLTSFCFACHRPAVVDGAFCVYCGAAFSSGLSSVIRCLACGTSVGQVDLCPNCQRPFTHSDHRLSFNRGPAVGTIFRVPQGTYEVGRDQLCPRDGYVSGRHFKVICHNGQLEIQDAGSTNKTLVAGVFAGQPLRLQFGQELKIAANVATYTRTSF